MQKLTLVSGLALILLISNLILTGVLLYNGRDTSLPGPPDRRQVIITQLSLDSAQIRAYDQLIAAHRHQIQTIQHEISRTKTQLYTTLVPSGTDTDTASLMLRLREQYMTIEQVHYQHFQAIRQLCRPDQQAAFEALTRQLGTLFGPPPHLPPSGRPHRPLP